VSQVSHQSPSSQGHFASSARGLETGAGSSSQSPSSQWSGDVSVPRELPDVTGFLVVVLVTVGLFIVPVGATLMQGPAIVASLFGGR
jgi:hypothetical protein